MSESISRSDPSGIATDVALTGRVPPLWSLKRPFDAGLDPKLVESHLQSETAV